MLHLRDVWLVDYSPAEVLRSDVVGGSSVAAVTTEEVFAFPVSFGYVAT